MFNYLNRANRIVCLLKTQLIYRTFFRYIGKRSVIGRAVFIANPQYISIGNGVSIRDGIRLEVVKSSIKRIPNLTIGNNVNIEQNVHIVCHNSIVIGNNVSITGHCAIVDTTHPYKDIYSHTKIGDLIEDDDATVVLGDGCFIGYGSVVLPNARLGKRVVVGANSVVSGNIPDYCVIAGAPARILQKYDTRTNQWLRMDTDRK